LDPEEGKEVGKVADDMVGTGGLEVGEGGVAIGDGAGARAGGTAHEDVDGHVAHDKRPVGRTIIEML